LRKKERIQLALVPGSRLHELQKILPAMIATFQLLKQDYPNLSATISTCGHIAPDVYKGITGTAAVDFFDGPLEEMFSHSDLALVTSGTATLQTALMGVPMIIMYKTSFITYLIYKTFITGIDHIGLPNIIAGEEVVPECIQGEMTPKSMVPILQNYIESPSAYQSVVKKLVSLKENLGSRKPSEEVTKLIKRISGMDGAAS
jgi:lipid-A-disaccharide synthase